MSGNSHLTEDDSEAVGRAIERMLTVNKTLKGLYLSHCGLNDSVGRHIAAGLTHNTSIAELNTSYNELTPEGCVHLFTSLHQNLSLKKLDISRNKLEMGGTEALAEMLSYNRSLTELDIRQYLKVFTEPEIRVIARGLLQNTTLETLKVWYGDKEPLEEEIKRLQASGQFGTSSQWNLKIIED